MTPYDFITRTIEIVRIGHKGDGETVDGIYVPYWTFDAHTESDYTGERGDAYYTTETYTTTENGRSSSHHSVPPAQASAPAPGGPAPTRRWMPQARPPA